MIIFKYNNLTTEKREMKTGSSNFSGNRSSRPYIALILTVILVVSLCVSLSSCDLISDSLDGFFEKDPIAASTYFDMKDVNAKIESALKEGKPDITMDIATSTDNIKNITENFSPFWGLPVQYTIESHFDGITVEGATDKGPVDVLRVTFTLEQSVNYYVYNSYKNRDFVIPKNKKEAASIRAVLPAIIKQIFGAEMSDENQTDYETVLSVHDWLVTNLEYNTEIDENSISNGSYGALVEKSTMCKGYTEAMQLILNCASNVEVISVVGEGNDNSSGWIGHAWNMVRMDDNWYQVDATFDDPVNNNLGRISHAYFGQNDKVLALNHKWSAEFWPASSGADFYYYRTNGLYAKSYESFKNIVISELRGRQPKSIEVAIEGFSLDDKDLQFMFTINRNVNTLYRNQSKMGNVTVVTLSPDYK
jgi:hypothetical protein